MKHIVIDARRINSSTGHYAKHLIDTLQILDHDNRYTIIVLEKEKGFYTPRAKNFQIITTRADHYTFAEQLSFASLLYRLRPDLVHFTMPQQPLLWFGRRVTTVHDTTLIRYENIDQNIVSYKIRKLIFTLLLKNVIYRSVYTLSPTRFVSKDLDEWTHHRYDDKLITTLIAGDTVSAKPKQINELEGHDYIYFVGNAFPYKNVGRIVEAFAIVKKSHPHLHLALAGKRDFFYENIDRIVKKQKIPDVHILGYISDEEKLWLTRNARAYVVASLSEGFHMPLLEAMEGNCPIISSNATCLPEVAGEAALYFDPHSVEELVEQINRLLDDPSLQNDLVAKGRRQLKKFSWETTGKATLSVYSRALNGQ